MVGGGLRKVCSQTMPHMRSFCQLLMWENGFGGKWLFSWVLALVLRQPGRQIEWTELYCEVSEWFFQKRHSGPGSRVRRVPK